MEDKWSEKLKDKIWIKEIEKKVKSEMGDWACFVCKKLGGNLFVCNFRKCRKAYHAKCRGLDESFSGRSLRYFDCESHSCFICSKPSQHQCYCCPKAVCQTCNVDGLFTKLEETRGFCFNCLKVLLPSDDQKEANLNGETMDSEGVKLEDLCVGDHQLEGSYCSSPDAGGSDKGGDKGIVSARGEEEIVSELNIMRWPQKGKRSKRNRMHLEEGANLEDLRFGDQQLKGVYSSFSNAAGSDKSGDKSTASALGEEESKSGLNILRWSQKGKRSKSNRMDSKEGINLGDLRLGDKKLTGVYSSFLNTAASDKFGDKGIVTALGEEETRSEINTIGRLQKGQGSKRNIASMKIKSKSEKIRSKAKKMKFVGWGSEALVGFLESIGKDTSKEISQQDVVSIIESYIVKNGLFDPHKKKKCVSDEKLYALFGKRGFLRNKVNKLLEVHYHKNAEFLEGFYNLKEESGSDSTPLAGKKKKRMGEFKIAKDKDVVIEASRSCFASIVTENIKLVYLNKSVVMELLKEPETFESMVIGSFVKVKSDPHVHRNGYQLVQVTGVKRTSSGEKWDDFLLQVSNRLYDFPISELSDGDFSKEECEDLRQRVKSGQLPRLTTVEVEEKAKSLRQVIMKEWIRRELTYLQNGIDFANEKGRRAQLAEYLDRRIILETETEQMRLLNEVPDVIAEVPDTEGILDDANQDLKKGVDSYQNQF